MRVIPVNFSQEHKQMLQHTDNNIELVHQPTLQQIIKIMFKAK
jgi:hypothetical protein